MGAQISQIDLKTDYYSGIISQSMIDISNQCSSNSIQTQNVVINTGGDVVLKDVKLEQDSSMNISCLQELSTNLDNQTNLIQDITEKIKNEIKDQNIGLQNASTKKISKAVSEIINNLDYNSITECLSINAQEQNVLINNEADGNVYIYGLGLKQTSNLVSNCIQKDSKTFKNISDLSQTVKTEIENSTTGFLNLGGLIAIGVIIILFILILIYVKKKFFNTSNNRVG